MEMHVKWSVILADRFGHEILTMLEIKGQVLHCVRVPAWLLDLNALLTGSLPMFLSLLNEISGGKRNMFRFGIIAENLKFLRMTLWPARFCGW